MSLSRILMFLLGMVCGVIIQFYLPKTAFVLDWAHSGTFSGQMTALTKATYHDTRNQHRLPMELEINEHLVQIKGDRITIPNGLRLGQDVRLVVDGNVEKILEQDNQDGTKDVIYMVKGIIVEEENE